MEKLGMPYMGNKRKLAKRIVDKILEENQNTKYVWDLFGGGGSISFEFLQRPQIERVIYNELNTGVVELLKDIIQNGVTEKYYQWIDRVTFNENRDRNDWFGGLVKVVWSFGNNQRDYLFGKDVEPIKREAHEYLFANGYDKTVNTRIRLVKQFKADKNIIGRFELEQLERLEQLQQLERLEQLQQLDILNKSYCDVLINTPIEETIIYLDPPYKNTGKYAEDVNHYELYEWIKKSPYKIYISEYSSEFEQVDEFKHRSTLSATSNNETLEKLYVHNPIKL